MAGLSIIANFSVGCHRFYADMSQFENNGKIGKSERILA